MEQCIRIADQLPSLREELLRYQLKKMEPMEDAEDYIGQFEQQQAQEAYFTLLSRWGEEDAAHAFAAKHMEQGYGACIGDRPVDRIAGYSDL